MCNKKIWGFILTMWYVNGDLRDGETLGYIEFYINYVVCKLELSKHLFKFNTRFYINYVVCKSV